MVWITAQASSVTPGAGNPKHSSEFESTPTFLSWGNFQHLDVRNLTPTSVLCLGLDRQYSSLACLLSRCSVHSALGLCLFSSLAQEVLPTVSGEV